MLIRQTGLLVILSAVFVFAPPKVFGAPESRPELSSEAVQDISKKRSLLPANRNDRQSILEMALLGRVNLGSTVSRRLRALERLVTADVVLKPTSARRTSQDIETALLKRISKNELIEAKEGYKLIKRAEANTKLRRYGKALEVYDLILKAYPGDTLSLLGRAECYYQRRRYKESISEYKEAKKLLGKDQNSMRYRPQILKHVADACYRQKDFFEAANIYNLICNGGRSRLIKIDFTGQASRGKSLFTVGDYKKSAKAFRKAIKHSEKLHGRPFTGTTNSEELEQRVEELEDTVNLNG